MTYLETLLFGRGIRSLKPGLLIYNEIVIHLEQPQLIPQARFALTQGIDPAPDRRHALPDIEVKPFDKRGIDRPATWRQDLFDGQSGAEHHAVCDADEAPAPGRFHHLRVEQRGQWYPPRLGHGASLLAPFGVYPLTKMGQ